MKIAIIGTQGLPNKYGGFETLVDYLTKYLGKEYDITVWCSSKIYSSKLKTYNNAKLKYLPFSANGFQSVVYDSVSILLSLKADKILILGASGGIILPFLFPWRNKFILNFGGLDWQRSKWKLFPKWFLKLSEMFAIKFSEKIIADNEAIKNYIKNEYGLDSTLIEYGGDQVNKFEINEKNIKKYPFLIFDYAFALARIQPDNNIDMILGAFGDESTLPIVFVGNWKNSDYGLKLKETYVNKNNVILIDAIYEQEELNLLRSNCKLYIHGHSAGGTNPALVEAMNLGLPVVAFESGFNKFTTEDKAIYFKTSNELKQIIQNIKDYNLEALGASMLEIAKRRYQWNIIAEKYSEVLES